MKESYASNQSRVVFFTRIFFLLILLAAFGLALVTDAESYALSIFGFSVSLIIILGISPSALIINTKAQTYLRYMLGYVTIILLGFIIKATLSHSGIISFPVRKEIELNYGYLIFAVVFTPILEEFLARHLLYRWLSKYVHFVLVCLLSGAFFYVQHSLYDVDTFIAGAYLCYVYHKTQSILPCIALHAGHNIYATTFHFLPSRLPDASTVTMLSSFFAVVIIGQSLSLLFVFFLEMFQEKIKQ